MDDNKKTNPRDGGSRNQNHGYGKKNNFHNKKKRPNIKSDRSGAPERDQSFADGAVGFEPPKKKSFKNDNRGDRKNGQRNDNRGRKNDETTEHKDSLNPASKSIKKGGQRNGGNRGKRGGRPQIHDGFDDIRMNPHYVVVDGADNDEDFEYSSPAVNDDMSNADATVGRNAVRELLRSGRSVDKIYVKKGSREGSLVVIVAEAVSRGIPIVEVDQNKLDKIADGENHQGVIALAASKEYCAVEDILEIARSKGEKPLIVVSDGIEDPHNLGALIRCAECAGAHGIIIPKRRAVGITPVVAKCSAGAVEHMAVARVTNLASTIADLKKAGVWIFAAEAGGDAYYETDFDVPAAIVFGSEGDGVSRLIKERSDFIVSIPMYGRVNSLNVSTAASVVLCHASRVRHGKA